MAPSKQPRMRNRRLLAAATAVFALVSAPSVAPACELLRLCADPSGDPAPRRRPAQRTSAWLFDAVNDARGTRGAARLSRDPELDALAGAHAVRLSRAARVFHNPDGLAARRRATGETLGENVGVGANLESIHEAFLASTSHRRTLLGRWGRLGIGIARRAGEVYVVQVFAVDGSRTTRAAPQVQPSSPVQRPAPSGRPVMVGRRTHPQAEAAPVLTSGPGERRGILPWVGAILIGLGFHAARRLRTWAS